MAAATRTVTVPETTCSISGPAQQESSQVERLPTGIVKSARPALSNPLAGIASAGMVVSRTVSSVDSAVGSGEAGARMAGLRSWSAR